MNLEELKEELLKDPSFRKEYYKRDIKLDIALMVDEARIAMRITQKELAKKMKTKQSAISRVESGDYLPSLTFLVRMAKALGTELIAPKFEFLEKSQALAIDKIIENAPLVEAACLLKRHAESYNTSTVTAKF